MSSYHSNHCYASLVRGKQFCFNETCVLGASNCYTVGMYYFTPREHTDHEWSSSSARGACDGVSKVVLPWAAAQSAC